MFQNMMVSAFTPLANVNETSCWENRPFTSKWPQKSPQQSFQKKSKRFRTSFTSEQLLGLERAFEKWEYISPLNRKQLAAELSIGEKNIKVWFQNRRMKKKRCVEGRTKSECDSTSTSSSIRSTLPEIKIELKYPEELPSTLQPDVPPTDSQASNVLPGPYNFYGTQTSVITELVQQPQYNQYSYNPSIPECRNFYPQYCYTNPNVAQSSPANYLSNYRMSANLMDTNIGIPIQGMVNHDCTQDYETEWAHVYDSGIY